MKKDLYKFIAKDDIDIIEAMKKIDGNTEGILFLTNDRSELVACITDGDIRRFLLANGNITDPAINAANKAPRSAQSVEEAIMIYNRRNFKAVPVVNSHGVIISVYTGEGNVEDRREPINIPIVINAGGKGTRLDPFTKILPKPLIPVGDLPIIEHIMNEFLTYNCTGFHIIVNYKRELIKAYFRDSGHSYDISWYDEESPMGTGGGLSLLKGKIDSTFFFSNCDNLLLSDYSRIFEHHRSSRNAITMICADKTLTVPYGVIEKSPEGFIESFREKPKMSFLINTGIYIVEPEVLDDIEDGVFADFPDIIKQQMDKGRRAGVFPVSENDWLDMGQLDELEKMRKRLYGE